MNKNEVDIQEMQWRFWNGFIWLPTETSVGATAHSNGRYIAVKQIIFLKTDRQLPASRYEVCSMELANRLGSSGSPVNGVHLRWAVPLSAAQ